MSFPKFPYEFIPAVKADMLVLFSGQEKVVNYVKYVNMEVLVF